MDYIISCISS